MRPRLKKLACLAACLCWFVIGVAAPLSSAQAQFFWFPWLHGRPRVHRPAPPPAPPATTTAPANTASGNLPPIQPKINVPPPPPPPDDRPYDSKLFRLAEILGALHYLRALCGANEGQLWRNQMEALVKDEGTTAVRRARLVDHFNDGYRGFRRTYRTCTDSATVAINRFVEEGSKIAFSLANPATQKKHKGKHARVDKRVQEEEMRR